MRASKKTGKAECRSEQANWQDVLNNFTKMNHSIITSDEWKINTFKHLCSNQARSRAKLLIRHQNEWRIHFMKKFSNEHWAHFHELVLKSKQAQDLRHLDERQLYEHFNFSTPEYQNRFTPAGLFEKKKRKLVKRVAAAKIRRWWKHQHKVRKDEQQRRQSGTLCGTLTSKLPFAFSRCGGDSLSEGQSWPRGSAGMRRR